MDGIAAMAGSSVELINRINGLEKENATLHKGTFFMCFCCLVEIYSILSSIYQCLCLCLYSGC